MKDKTNDAQLPMGGPVLHKAGPATLEGPKGGSVRREVSAELFLPRVAPYLKSFTSTVRTYRTKAEMIAEMGSLTEKEAEVLSEAFRLTAKFFQDEGAKVLDRVKR